MLDVFAHDATFLVASSFSNLLASSNRCPINLMSGFGVSFRFFCFLKAVENINRFGESNRINRSVCVAVMVLNYFQNARASNDAAQRLCRWVRRILIQTLEIARLPHISRERGRVNAHRTLARYEEPNP
jgi:hypothetical protein